MEIERLRGVATIITYPLVDGTGAPVTAAGALDSEIDAWSDGTAPNGFVDCTNEATEVGTTGQYYLSLTATEMDADYVIIQTKSTGAKTQTILIRTRQVGILHAGLAQSATASTIVLAATAALGDNNANGSFIYIAAGTGAGQSRVITSYVTATDTATVSPNWTTTPDATSVAVVIASPPAPTDVAGIPAVNVTHNAGTAITSAAGIQDVKVASIATAAVSTILTTAMTEAYAADNAAPTVAQALFAIQQFLQEKSISDTTCTVKKLDGATTAMTFTLNNATTPTSITRAA